MADRPNHARTTPAIIRGTTFVLLAFDIAFAIDLEAAERLLAGEAAERPNIRHTRKAPPYFEYRPAPIRVTVTGEPIACSGTLPSGKYHYATLPAVEILIFDFGAVSITYRLDNAGPLEGLVNLAEALYDNPVFADDARARIARLIEVIRPALQRAHTDKAMEDYVIHQIEEVGGGESGAEVAALADTHAGLLARVLRSERDEISAQESAEALSSRASYKPSDVALIDWNAAILLDRDADDVRSVLEFANVEALELRMLDDRLDQIVDDAYRMVAEGRTRKLFGFPISSRELHRVARLQMDSAILYEGVNNAIKLVGDQYLARVYRMAAAKFHLPERDSSIERKLSTLEAIYTKFQDRQATLRLEILEWIVIILIFVSIILPFLPWGGGK